jgi:6-phosphogluconolactonase (cycloisomerase 2 family)
MAVRERWTLGCVTFLVLAAGALPARAALLTFVERQVDGEGPIDGLNGARAVVVSPQGTQVYVAGFGDDAVAVFTRDVATGRLTFVQAVFEGEGEVRGLVGPGALAVSADGNHVYVASFGALAVFRRDAISGALSFVEALFGGEGGVQGLATPRAVIVSPDGAHVYTASLEGAVAAFRRDADSGALGFVAAEFDGQNGVEGLSGAQGIASSPDGTHVYVASFIAGAVVVFRRAAATGRLTFVESQFDAQGVHGVAGASSVAVSPDGAYVYAAGASDGSIAVFRRDPPTGELTFVEAQFDGQSDVEGIAGASSVAVGFDAALLYVAGTTDNAVAAFRRDAASGTLTFVEAQFEAQDGVIGLGGVTSVAASPDGAHLYATGFAEASVAVFRVSAAAPTTTPTRTIPAVTITPTAAGTVTPVLPTQPRRVGGGCALRPAPAEGVTVWALLAVSAIWVLLRVRARADGEDSDHSGTWCGRKAGT